MSEERRMPVECIETVALAILDQHHPENAPHDPSILNDLRCDPVIPADPRKLYVDEVGRLLDIIIPAYCRALEEKLFPRQETD